jgi:hypothetical protein
VVGRSAARERAKKRWPPRLEWPPARSKAGLGRRVEGERRRGEPSWRSRCSDAIQV